MKKNVSYFVAIIAMITSSINADLPPIKGDDWLGYFVATKNRKSFFGISTDSESIFYIFDKKGELLRSSNPVKVKFQVLTTDSNGKLTRKTLDSSSLTTESEAAANPRSPITFSGKVTGKAAFETTVKIVPIGFTAGGKITETGDSKTPLFFGIGIELDPYKGIDLKDKDDKKSKEFEKAARRDKLEIITTSGEEKSYKLDEEIHFSSDFPNGVSSITLRSHRYEDVEYVMTASKGSAIHFLGDKKAPVYKSLDLLWKANEGFDSSTESLTMKAE